MLNSFFGSSDEKEVSNKGLESSDEVDSQEVDSQEVDSQEVESEETADVDPNLDDDDELVVLDDIDEFDDQDDIEMLEGVDDAEDGDAENGDDEYDEGTYDDHEDDDGYDDAYSEEDDDDDEDDSVVEIDNSAADLDLETVATNGTGKASASEDAHEEDIVEPEDALPPITLEELPDLLKQAAANAGWTSLMPVQAKALPYMLAERDLMVQSRTGSGKTGAFLLPILERIDTSLNAAQALILVPTRELAQQVAKEAAMLAPNTGMRSIAVYGGVSYGPQIDAFEKGAHLVIGTPGRVLDHLLRRTLRLDNLQIMVFDEADRMLSMGFYPDMREVQRYLPNHDMNAYMFSATFPANVLRLAREFLVDPDFLSLSKDRVHVSNAEHIYYMVPSVKKDRSLIRLIEMENPDSAIIFCNTKVSVNYVTVVLQRFGYDADQISSDLNQKDREAVLARVKGGKLRFLVATDVAARGIDIHELSHVFQYEPPEDPESYIHRAGRTARAGASGKAISLIENIAERMQLERIAQRYSIEMEEMELPTDEDVTGTVAERVTTLLEAKLRDRDNLHTERMRRFIPIISEWGNDEEGQKLLAMLLDDFYQQSLHTPLVPLDEPTETRSQKARGGRKSSGSRSSGSRSSRSSSSKSGSSGRGSGRSRNNKRDNDNQDNGSNSSRSQQGSGRRRGKRRASDENAAKQGASKPRNARRNDKSGADSDKGQTEKATSSKDRSTRRRATRKSDAARKAAEERSKARRERLRKNR